jgi:hypothetical protein
MGPFCMTRQMRLDLVIITIKRGKWRNLDLQNSMAVHLQYLKLVIADSQLGSLLWHYLRVFHE